MGRISRLGKSSVIYGAGNILTRFIGLLLLPLFTAYLSPGDYGILAMLTLLSTVAQAVFALGMGAAMGPSYFESGNARAKSKTVWTAFFVLLASAGVLLLAGWLFPGPLGLLAAQSSDHPLLVSLTATGCAFSILSTPFSQRVQFDDRAKAFVAVTLATSVVSIGLSVLLVAVLRQGAQGMIIAQTTGFGVNLILFMAVGAGRDGISFSRPLMMQLLRLGLPLVPAFGFQFALMQGNRYMLKAFSGLEIVGIYSIGFNLGTVMNIAIGALSTAWYPYFMSFLEKQEEAKKLFARIFTYYVFGFGLLCVAFFAFAHPVVGLMTQSAFHEAYKVVGFSATAYFFIGVFNLLLPAVYYAKEIKHVTWIQGAAVVASLGVNLILIRSLGLLGAGLALCLSHFFLAAFQYAFNWSRRGRYFFVRYEWTSIFKALSVFELIAALSFLGPKENLTLAMAYGTGLMLAACAWVWILIDADDRIMLADKAFFVLSRRPRTDNEGSVPKAPFPGDVS